MGIFDRLREKFRKKLETEIKQTDSAASEPMPPSSPSRMDSAPAEEPAEEHQPESNASEPSAKPEGNEPERDGIKLPVKRHILKEIEDPFNKKEQSRIFQENLDLIALFKEGEFSEEEALSRQRSAITARLKKKRIDPSRAKRVIDDYAFYFRKELEQAKNVRKANA